jgi:thymidylate kinase
MHAEDGAVMSPTGRVAPRPTAPPLDLIATLAAALDDAAVSWCHWKSNEAIDRSASGDNDLDLLIARGDAGRFEEVLARLGFRVARPPADRQLPGILDHYGVDDATGTVVHVHAHYQLVLGDDMTKNVRLPVERAYLRSCTRVGLFPLPSAEFEYIVFVLRMVLKHSTVDGQLDRKARLTASERRELAYLEERIDPAEVARLVSTHVPFVGLRLFNACRRAASEQLGHAARAVVAARLVVALRAHTRHREVLDVGLRVWRRRWRRYGRRLPWLTSKKRLDHGGLIIALVGGDGSGKSTAADMLAAHLGHTFEVVRVHMGKPEWSRLTRLVKRPMRRLRQYGLFRTTSAPAWHDFGGRFPGLGYILWHTLTARDRALTYQRARRAAARGAVVVSDRFPVHGIRFMDGPRTDLPGVDGRPAARWLAQRERRYYDHILPPDVTIVLRVPPAVAVERRSGENADVVRRRVAEVYDADWADAGAVVVDATQPVEDVHAQITAAVWSAL